MSIKAELVNTHKNLVLCGNIANVWGQKATQGMQSSIGQRFFKLRLQYLSGRDALRRSGSSSDEKDYCQYFDMINPIIGSRPTSNPVGTVDT